MAAAARAQEGAARTIGWLSLRSANTNTDTSILAALRQGLNQTGYVEGKNLKIESRFGEGKHNRLPALAAELVRRQVEVSPAGMLEKGEVQVAGSTLGVDEFYHWRSSAPMTSPLPSRRSKAVPMLFMSWPTRLRTSLFGPYSCIGYVTASDPAPELLLRASVLVSAPSTVLSLGRNLPIRGIR